MEAEVNDLKQKLRDAEALTEENNFLLDKLRMLEAEVNDTKSRCVLR